MKVAERETARRLRAEDGLAVREIAKRVGVSVSSVSLWVRDVPLTAEQEAALELRNPVRNGQMLGARNNSERCRAIRRQAQAHGRDLARAGELPFIAGCMLYWGEGSKRRNQACLSNSDVDMLAMFLRFARRYYEPLDGRLTFSVNCFLNNGLSLDEIESWWLERLALPPSVLRTAAVNRPSSASQLKKHRVLLYGTGRLTVHSTFVVQSIYGGIQEIAGIDRPEWLDL